MSFIKHGDHGSEEYHVWEGMIARCHNPNSAQFKDYGGRGITVCDRWRRYENFLEDMGRRPDKSHTIERNENDAGYAPSNCRWATRTEQQNNTRRSRFVMLAGKKMTIAEAARALGIKYMTAYSRIYNGHSIDLK